MLATDAADTVKVLKEKISVFNIAPEHISITNVARKNGVWVIEFTYMFRNYIAEVDEEGRLLLLKANPTR